MQQASWEPRMGAASQPGAHYMHPEQHASTWLSSCPALLSSPMLHVHIICEGHGASPVHTCAKLRCACRAASSSSPCSGSSRTPCSTAARQAHRDNPATSCAALPPSICCLSCCQVRWQAAMGSAPATAAGKRAYFDSRGWLAGCNGVKLLPLQQLRSSFLASVSECGFARLTQ